MDLSESRSDGAILGFELHHIFHAEESLAFDCLVRCFKRLQAAVIDLDEFLQRKVRELMKRSNPRDLKQASHTKSCSQW